MNFDVLLPIVIICMSMMIPILWMRGYFRVKEKQIDMEASLAAEKAAQYAASNAQLEQRVRVLEQIVTDSGAQTANQIEALRDRTAIEKGETRQ